MSDIILPTVSRNFMRELMHARLNRKDQPIPDQAAIDAYHSLESIVYQGWSNYRSVSGQLNFQEGVLGKRPTLVLQQQIYGRPGDASYEETDSVLAVYRGCEYVGKMHHHQPDVGRANWVTDINRETITELKPFLDALQIYNWLQIYVIPQNVRNQPEYRQLELMQKAAFPFYEGLANNDWPQEISRRLTMVPKLQNANEVPISYAALEHFR